MGRKKQKYVKWPKKLGGHFKECWNGKFEIDRMKIEDKSGFAFTEESLRLLRVQSTITLLSEWCVSDWISNKSSLI